MSRRRRPPPGGCGGPAQAGCRGTPRRSLDVEDGDDHADQGSAATPERAAGVSRANRRFQAGVDAGTILLEPQPNGGPRPSVAARRGGRGSGSAAGLETASDVQAARSGRSVKTRPRPSRKAFSIRSGVFVTHGRTARLTGVGTLHPAAAADEWRQDGWPKRPGRQPPAEGEPRDGSRSGHLRSRSEPGQPAYRLPAEGRVQRAVSDHAGRRNLVRTSSSSPGTAPRSSSARCRPQAGPERGGPAPRPGWNADVRPTVPARRGVQRLELGQRVVDDPSGAFVVLDSVSSWMTTTCPSLLSWTSNSDSVRTGSDRRSKAGSCSPALSGSTRDGPRSPSLNTSGTDARGSARGFGTRIRSECDS